MSMHSRNHLDKEKDPDSTLGIRYYRTGGNIFIGFNMSARTVIFY
jgi:hypothetical protein